MPSQLDILALEPFFGGHRRTMLQTLVRYSRHRWTLLKLPPRRIERRMTTAAHWFAEQLSRHWAGRLDVLFTSEAMNLADLFQRMPALAKKPSVVYFHDNQVPDVLGMSDAAVELINVSTANAATEIWFNSAFHLREFSARVAHLLDQNPGLKSLHTVKTAAAKARLMRPPIDMAAVNEAVDSAPIQQQKKTLFIETRDADMSMLNQALLMLHRQKEAFKLITVGPVENLSPVLERRTIGEQDDKEQIRGIAEAGILVSGRKRATSDEQMLRAMALGTWPVAPRSGVYPEMIPATLRDFCLYDGTAEALAARIRDAWYLGLPTSFDQALSVAAKQYDAMTTAKAIDDRLLELAGK